MPQVATLAATEITASSAIFNGTIAAVGDPAYTERGFVYGAMHNPTIEDNTKKVVSGSGTGAFFISASGLTTGTTYYVRAYAHSSKGTAYGQEISFMANDPNYVILSAAGLMVQKTDITGSSPVSWSTAQSLCENSTLAGYTDWRVPTQAELATLYNERNTIGGFTTSATNTNYWSSSYYTSSNYYYQNFSSGAQYYNYTTSSYRARCVRSNN
jgi:hypothetical protein